MPGPPEIATRTPARAYLRIADELRNEIREQERAPHSALPPERELALRFGVSRMTLRQALRILQNEGLVYRGSTRGTFVAEPRIPLRLGSFSQEVSRSGRQPGAQLLWAREEAPAPEVGTALDLGIGETVHALQRLRRTDNEPLAVETTYYPAAPLPGLLDVDLSGSLWTVLQTCYGVEPSRTTASVEVVVLSEEMTDLLDVPIASSGLQLVRRTFDGSGRCIEFARDVYRADRVELIIERSLAGGD